MIENKKKTFLEAYTIVEILITLISFTFVYSVSISHFIGDYKFMIIFLIIIPTLYAVIKLLNFNSWRLVSYSTIFIEYFIINTILQLLIFASIFILKLEGISRFVILLFGTVNFFALFSIKLLIYKLLKRKRKQGHNSKKILIIANKDSIEYIEKIKTISEWGYRIVTIISDSQEIFEKYQTEFNILPEQTNLQLLIEMDNIDEVIYCKNELNFTNMQGLIYMCQEIGVVFKMKAYDWLEMLKTKAEVTHIEDTTFFSFSNVPNNYFALTIKNVFDFLFSLVIVSLSSPFFVLIAILIKTTSKGPLFFKQERVGLRGRKFTVYKFRTMVDNAEKLREQLLSKNEQDGPVFKIKNDPRITKIGRFLRKTSLDEFPQFINVLKGEMSIVGPRPPLPSEVELYQRWQLRRLSMKPGITCIWQVSGRNKITFERWMQLDLEYIDNWSLRLDVRLILKTFNTILKLNGQ